MLEEVLKSLLVGLIAVIVVGLVTVSIFLAMQSCNIIIIALTVGTIIFIGVSSLRYFIYYGY